ncbi:MAG: hypothetical protein Q4C58_01620 [Eubacteriales bacterium]|nr:hypothetical protein [Eubacteriales bacterium]
MEKKKHLQGKAYRRFFEGYTEFAVPKENGKGDKILRIYTAEYYRCKLGDRQFFLLKLFYVCLYLVMLICFVTAATEPLQSNSVWYVVLPQTCCVFFFGWLFLGLMKYLFAQRNMTVYGYRTSTQNVKRAAMGLGFSLAWLSLTNACFVALHIRYILVREIFCIMRFLVGTGAAVLLYFTECRVVYQKMPNPQGNTACAEEENCYYVGK